MFIGLIPEAINLFLINSGLSFIVTFLAFFAKNSLQFSVSTPTENSLFTSSSDFYFFKVSNYSAVTLYYLPSEAVILKSLVLVPLAIVWALKCPTAPLEIPAKAEQPAAIFYQSLTVRDSLLANLAQDALDSGDKALAADKAVTILGTYLTKEEGF